MKLTYNTNNMSDPNELKMNCREAAMIINNEGIIEYANNQLYDIFCYSNEELEGKSLDILLKDEYKLGSKQLFLRGIGGEQHALGMTTVSLIGVDKNNNSISLKARFKKIGAQKSLIVFEKILY